MATIDKEMLRVLASDPKETSASISESLGLGAVHNLYYELGKDTELKTIYNEGRAKAKGDSKGKPAKSVTPKQRASSSTPPRKSNTNGKGHVSDLLLRKIVHEFEHIKIYEEVSERFDEIATELRQSL